MKLLFDLSSAQPQGDMLINGGGEYSLRIFNIICEKVHSSESILILLNKKRGQSSKIFELSRKYNSPILYFEDIHDIENYVNNEKIDKLFLPVCYSEYSELHIPDHVVLYTVIHDLSGVYYDNLKVKYGRYPNLDKLNFLRKIRDKFDKHNSKTEFINRHNKLLNLNHNQIIITDSFYSKTSMKMYLENALNKEIKVIYVPEKICDISTINADDVMKKYGLIDYKYFLLTAGCRWTKNNAIVLFTLDKMFSEAKYDNILKDYKVILTGTNTYYENYYKTKLNNKDRFIFDGYVDDDILEALYSRSKVFVFPSVLEGFGLPPIEAMKYGTIVACSTAMSIPEICGDAAVYFDPYDKKSIEMALLTAFDSTYEAYLREKIMKRIIDLDEIRKKHIDDFLELVLEDK